jgi:DNA-binding transcriptional MerR regulator
VAGMSTDTSATAPVAHAPSLGIRDVAELSGLSQDTLRWYEKEGLLPAVPRRPDGRRAYSERDVAMVVMLAKLRDSDMPTEDMREFARLVAGGAATHGRRLDLLQRHRRRIEERQAALNDALRALDDKSAHYRHLIAEQLDCDGDPVSAEIAVQQRKGMPA